MASACSDRCRNVFADSTGQYFCLTSCNKPTREACIGGCERFANDAARATCGSACNLLCPASVTPTPELTDPLCCVTPPLICGGKGTRETQVISSFLKGKFKELCFCAVVFFVRSLKVLFFLPITSHFLLLTGSYAPCLVVRSRILWQRVVDARSTCRYCIEPHRTYRIRGIPLFVIFCRLQKENISLLVGLKGAQAWDIRERFFYTNQMLMVRWLGDWRKKWTFESWSHYFKVFAANFLLSVRSACA
jgi:hypothetical protein